MERRTFETPLGPIWLHGEASAFESDRPVLFLLTGAFSTADGAPSAAHLAPHVAPYFSVVGAHLPGNHCPPLLATSVGVYAAAYSHALDQAFARRPIVALGASIGGLVVMGLNSPQVRSALVIEPPLVGEKLWPLTGFLRGRLAQPGCEPHVRDFIVNVFGVTETEIQPRDYRPLLDSIRMPAVVIVGDQPLFPRRPLSRLPSLVDQPERDLIARHPGLSLEIAPGAGHNVLENASAFSNVRMGQLLRQVVPDFRFAER